jgi:hypothetical protein
MNSSSSNLPYRDHLLTACLMFCTPTQLLNMSEPPSSVTVVLSSPTQWPAPPGPATVDDAIVSGVQVACLFVLFVLMAYTAGWSGNVLTLWHDVCKLLAPFAGRWPQQHCLQLILGEGHTQQLQCTACSSPSTAAARSGLWDGRREVCYKHGGQHGCHAANIGCEFALTAQLK